MLWFYTKEWENWVDYSVLYVWMEGEYFEARI